MADKNPFTVLGLAPELVQRLSDDEIHKVIKSQYRVLAGLWHTSVNPGNTVAEKKFRAVQEAYEQLTINKKEYAATKKSFLQPRKTKLHNELQEAHAVIQETRQRELLLEQCLQRFWQVRGSPNSIFQQPVPHSKRVQLLLSSFHLPPFRLILHDTLHFMISMAMGGKNLRKKADYHGREPAAGIVKSFELERDNQGLLRRYKTRRRKFNPMDENAPPNIPLAFIHGNSQAKNTSWYWQRDENSAEELNIHLVGSINAGNGERQETGELEALLPPANETKVQHFEEAKKGYPWETFCDIAPYVSPLIEPQALLVATQVIDDEPRYLILGKIMEMHLPEYKTMSP